MVRNPRFLGRRDFLRSGLAAAVGAAALAPAGSLGDEASRAPSRTSGDPSAKAGGRAKVKVLFTAAVEDFVVPRSDDIVMEVARILTRAGVRGNFHVTGDKIRTLAARGRKDVIDALAEHVVGYHTNTHGMRPFLGHLLDDKDWDASVRSVLASEAAGAWDLQTAMARMPTYFVSEFIKGPQLIQAFKLMGIPRGVMVSSLWSLPGSAVWFCGSLMLATGNLIALEHGPDTPNRMEVIRKHVDQRLEQAGTSDGVAMAYIHPYKYASPSSKSWGAWNAAYRGAASPAGPLEMPPLYPEAVTADLLDQFERLIGYIKSRDDAVFTDFNAMASAFCSPTASWVSRPTLARLAERSLKRLDYVVEDGVSTSPAEVFGLLVRALACYRRSGRLPEQVMVRPLLGPVKEPVQRQGVKTDGRAVINACVRLDHQLDETGYLPASTPVLYVSLGPGTLLRSMARTYLELSAGKEPPEVLGDLDGPELPEVSGHEYFQEKTFTHDSLYPDGFTGEQVCRYCLWQSWSLKPAVEKS